MTRRSTPQAKIDREAWPVTVRIRVPERGFGTNEPSAWLKAKIGLTEYATTPAHSLGGDAVAFHFRSIEAAQAFRERFPMLQMADGTANRGYKSPHLPNGRQP